MIYNLVAYLKTEFPTLVFTSNGWLPDTPEEALTVIQNGGEEEAYYPRKTYNVQVMSRSGDKTVARTNIYSVYNKLRVRFGLELPAAIVGETIHAAIKTWQISPNQVPGYLGSDDRNLEMWSVNFRVITN